MSTKNRLFIYIRGGQRNKNFWFVLENQEGVHEGEQCAWERGGRGMRHYTTWRQNYVNVIKKKKERKNKADISPEGLPVVWTSPRPSVIRDGKGKVPFRLWQHDNGKRRPPTSLTTHGDLQEHVDFLRWQVTLQGWKSGREGDSKKPLYLET